MYRIGGFSMTIGRLTPLQQATPLKECFSVNDLRTLVAKQLGVDIEFVTSEAHFTNDLGADLYRVPENVTRGRFPDGGESDSTWRTQEARHVGSHTIAPGF